MLGMSDFSMFCNLMRVKMHLFKFVFYFISLIINVLENILTCFFLLPIHVSSSGNCLFKSSAQFCVHFLPENIIFPKDHSRRKWLKRCFFHEQDRLYNVNLDLITKYFLFSEQTKTERLRCNSSLGCNSAWNIIKLQVGHWKGLLFWQ